MASPFINTMTSFSGADLMVTFANKVIGELQQISWSIEREKAPVFTLGSPDARSFSRGKRGIAGTLIFSVFDRDALIEGMKDVWEDIAPKAMFTAAGNVSDKGALNEDFTNAFDLSQWNQAASDTLATGEGFSGTTDIAASTGPASDGSGDNVNIPSGFATIGQEDIQYVDQLPPFDITLTFANEYGQTAFKKIYDVDLMNEASGASVDSIVMEQQMSYVARRISPLTSGVYTRENKGQVVAKKVTEV